MEVIVIEAQAWKEIINRIDNIEENISALRQQNWEDRWITGEELRDILHISPRTEQTYRDERLLAFSQMGHKILYRMKDVQDFLLRHQIKATSAI